MTNTTNPDLRFPREFTPDETEAAITAAEQHVQQLVFGGARPRASIPVQPDDTDVVINGALAACRRLLANARRYWVLKNLVASIVQIPSDGSLADDRWDAETFGYDGAEGIQFTDSNLDRLLDDMAELNRRVPSPDDVGFEAAEKAFNEWEEWYFAELEKRRLADRDAVRREAREGKPIEFARDDEATRMILLLVDKDVPISDIEAWTDEQVRAVEDCAGREHLHASDNDDVERVPMPAFLEPFPSADDVPGMPS